MEERQGLKECRFVKSVVVVVVVVCMWCVCVCDVFEVLMCYINICTSCPMKRSHNLLKREQLFSLAFSYAQLT